MTSYQPSELLERLVQQLIDETIDASGMEQLDVIFQQDPHARRWYLEEIRMHSSLHRWASTLGKESPSVDEIIKRQRQRNIRTALVSAAAVLLLAVIAMRLFFIEEKQPTLTFEVAPGTQFVLTHDRQYEVLNDAAVLEEGSRLQLSQGTVELHFSSGVRSIVMAPADVTLQDKGTLYMRQGTAWFHVPKEAVGFQVKTEDFDIVDLGTKFGVLANPDDHDEVHVFQGKVQVTAKRLRKESVTLVAKDARRVDSVGQLDVITSQSSIFLTSLPQALPHLHWSFDQRKDKGLTVRGNLPQVDLVETKIVQANQSEPFSSISGKFGKALLFPNTHSYVGTNWQGIGGNAPRTVAYWIKLPPQKEYHHQIVGWGGFLGKEDHTTSQFYSLVETNEGKTTIGVSLGGYWISGTTPVDDNRWHHIAYVYTGRQKSNGHPEIHLYIDGLLEKVSARFFDDVPLKSDGSIAVDTDISNANSSPLSFFGDSWHGQKRDLNITPSMDELFIFRVALSHQQIRNLYLHNNYGSE